jgi:serine/threonine protein kinase
VAALSPGDVLLDRYELRQLIGQGGMGSVYRAFDRTRGEEVALKLLLPSLVASEHARERFVSEGKISSRLSHPNIVNVFDVQRSGEHYFLTMELLKGRTLRQLLQLPAIDGGSAAHSGATLTLSVGQALDIARQIGSALTYAHRFTVHRDIKPENIWVEEDGGYKLMDFGIARLLTGSQLTKTAAVMGSAYYMSPEQLKDSKSIDGRADQYSLAVVLYEAICGDVPMGRAKSLSAQKKGVPRSFSNAIDRALEVRPEARFTTVDAFVSALRARGPALSREMLLYGGGAFGAAALIAVVVLAWPAFRSLLPDPTGAARDKGHAVQAQAALSELTKRIEIRQRDIEQRVRDEQSAMDRYSDRSGMARTPEERDSLQRQLVDTQREFQIASVARKIAVETLFSVEALSSLKAQQALGESNLKDGHVQEAATVLSQARDAAKRLLDSADNLEPAIIAEARLGRHLELARKTIAENGGNAGVVLAQSLKGAAAAHKALQSGDSTTALATYNATGAAIDQAMQQFLEYLVSQYAVIAQKKMAANDLDTAQEAINRGKALQALEAHFR